MDYRGKWGTPKQWSQLFYNNTLLLITIFSYFKQYFGEYTIIIFRLMDVISFVQQTGIFSAQVNVFMLYKRNSEAKT